MGGPNRRRLAPSPAESARRCWPAGLLRHPCSPGGRPPPLHRVPTPARCLHRRLGAARPRAVAGAARLLWEQRRRGPSWHADAVVADRRPALLRLSSAIGGASRPSPSSGSAAGSRDIQQQRPLLPPPYPTGPSPILHGGGPPSSALPTTAPGSMEASPPSPTAPHPPSHGRPRGARCRGRRTGGSRGSSYLGGHPWRSAAAASTLRRPWTPSARRRRRPSPPHPASCVHGDSPRSRPVAAWWAWRRTTTVGATPALCVRMPPQVVLAAMDAGLRACQTLCCALLALQQISKPHHGAEARPGHDRRSWAAARSLLVVAGCYGHLPAVRHICAMKLEMSCLHGRPWRSCRL